MTNKVEVNWQGNMRFESIAPEGRVMIDSAPDVGGNNDGLRPKAMMLTALGGCTGMDIISLLRKMRAEVDDLKIEVVGNLTEEHPKYYDKVKIIYRFYGSDFKKAKIQKAIDLSIDRYCGVMEMFRGFAEITTEVIYIEQ
jgi:putative redox protein